MNQNVKSKNYIIPASIAFALMLVAAPPAARADALQDAGALFRQGNHAQAMERVNAVLATRPDDPQARFLKGVILTEQNQREEAIKVFQSLSQDRPDLPEPHNNLAVLYASKGQYDKARAALEMAIRTHPSYATAHENLGDIYARLASEAYRNALQIDRTNAAAQTKLALIRDLFTVPGAPQPGVKLAARNPENKPAVAPERPAPAPKPAAKEPAAPVKPPVASGPVSVAPGKAKMAKAAAAPATAAPAPAAEPSGGADEVIAAVQAWARAWSDKNVAAYLGHYTADFTPPGGNRNDWVKERTQRISRPKSIDVTLTGIKVEFLEPQRARVTFRQSYRSDSFRGSAQKALTLAKADGKWLIRSEEAGR